MRFFKITICLLLGATLFGCGGNSQRDLMMRAAQRPRDPDDDEEVAEASTITPQVATSAGAPPSSTPNTNVDSSLQANGNSVSPPANGGGTSASSSPANSSSGGAPVQQQAQATPQIQGSVPPPIESRRPAEPLSEQERSQRAIENIKKIAAALQAYTEKNKRFPARGIATGSGIMVLSWRVELLPFLGYQDLYNQFDLKQPWDSPKNAALLERIPDCYVSPERFDTNTNYLGVAGSSYIFQDQVLRLSRIEDGPENTLAVLEVNDELAVPWTSPMDYAPEPEKTAAGIGQLRPDGTYGVWANGWATLLKPGIPDAQLHRAFTYESGDVFRSGEIHNALNVAPRVAASKVGKAGVTTNNQAFDGSSKSMPEAASSPAGSPTSSTKSLQPSATQALTRLTVPSRAALADATARVEKLFESQMKPTGNFDQLVQLGRQMLDSAEGMRSDPAGAFALQNAAMELAVRCGNLELLKSALDSQVLMFEVDALPIHAEQLDQFGQQNGREMSGVVDGREYLRAILPVVYGLLKEDSYDNLEDLAQFALAYESRSGNREFIADLNRLKSQISSAQNFFRRTGDALSQLRQNPEDAAAAFAVGRYLTFIKGDWSNGLPVLAVGENARLAQMAKADLATQTSSPEQMLSTADSWWSLGEETSNELFKSACRERAAYWYQLTMQALPDSLSKLHVKSRLEEYDKSFSGSPLGAIKELAEGMGMDLDLSLIALKEPMSKVAARGDEDEDD